MYSKVKDTWGGRSLFYVEVERGRNKMDFQPTGEGRLILGNERGNLGVIALTQSLVRCVGKMMDMFHFGGTVWNWRI